MTVKKGYKERSFDAAMVTVNKGIIHSEAQNPNWNRCRAVLKTLLDKGISEFTSKDFIKMTNVKLALDILVEFGDIESTGKKIGNLHIYRITDLKPVIPVIVSTLVKVQKEAQVNVAEEYIMETVLPSYKIIGRLIHTEKGTKNSKKDLDKRSYNV